MRVSATAQLCIRRHLMPYSVQLLFIIQIFLIRQKAVHKISSFVLQFLQKRKKSKHQSQFMAGFMALNTKRRDI